MAADREEPSGRSAAAGRAKDLAAKTRRRGGEAGRLRLHLLTIILVIAAQCGLAAALSWWLAHDVLGRPAPIFAPSAAVGTIVAALGQRTVRTAELMLGVLLGLLVSDLLVRSVGFGLWQIGLVVALSIAIALLMTGRSGALVAQAGSTAVLIAVFSPTKQGLEWARIVDAGVGSAVGLAVVALLLPISPMRVLDNATAPVTATLHTQLREVAHALAKRDPDRATRALDQLSGMDPDLARMHEARAGAEEVTAIAPARWKRRIDVERYGRGIQHVDRVSVHCRALARWAATTLQYHEPVPEELPGAVDRLAEAIQLLRREARAGRPFDQTRNAVLNGARLAGQAYGTGGKPFSDAVVIQLRTMASDLLRATGCEPETANRMVREAATS
ncbi:FUSC family protein [Micromonospora soli]|uniref:FUSC family protein n=1 Tax=Micromonospora sp. NBRC 110009 TaxID=3061627 RepID=UPI002672F651|nr:FUSC family protein [Micromonospora sp. NBRC 110009]WKT98470.1 FUSC family protein [Micromonospora sp. NBRC 110009]